jgi:filamentous hemagglutinin family protein
MSPAEVVLDNTFGPSEKLAGPAITVTPNRGATSGANLLFSFKTLDLAQGESLTFSGPTDIARVMSRVTGGHSSRIDGTIRCTIPNADVYLINPAGLLFGPNAALDVMGSFVASTADVVQLGDGGRLLARAQSRSETTATFTSAAPVAFGFLGKPAPIQFVQSHLSVLGGKTIALVGGNTDLQGTRLPATSDATPPAGVNIVSLASRGDVQLDPTSATGVVTISPTAHLGQVVVRDDPSAAPDVASSIHASNRILIRAGKLQVVNSTLRSAAAANASIGIDLGVSETTEIVGRSLLRSSNTGSNAGGAIAINTSQLVMKRAPDQSPDSFAAVIRTEAEGAGPGGEINITASKSIELSGQADIHSLATGSGAGGRVTLIAPLVRLTGILDTPAVVRTESRGATAMAGRGGDVKISASRIESRGAAEIYSLAEGLSAGGGNVELRADAIDLAGGGESAGGGSAVLRTETRGSGAGGTASLIASQNLRIQSPATLYTNSTARPAASNPPALAANGGAGGGIFLSSPSIELLGGDVAPAQDGPSVMLVRSLAAGSGPGGAINFDTSKLRITGTVDISTLTPGPARGGDIVIDAHEGPAVINGAAQGAIFQTAALQGSPASAQAGNVHLSAGELTLTGDCRFFTRSASDGAAGHVAINVSALSGASLDPEVGGFFSQADGTKPGGDVSIQITGAAPADLSFARLRATSAGLAPAGHVTINGIAPPNSVGGIIRDGSAGAAGALEPTDGVYVVIAEDGLQLSDGVQVLHSFSRFDVGNAETVRFTGANTVHDVIARVTGHARSTIDGKLTCDIPGANLFLINPAGAVMSESASISVSGAFAVTTANAVRLADGLLVPADLTTPSLEPAGAAAFVFSSGGAQGGIIDIRAGLSLASGQVFTAVGGSVHVLGGSVGLPRGIVVPAGQINLFAVPNAGGQILLDATDINAPAGNPLPRGAGGEIVISGSLGAAIDDPNLNINGAPQGALGGGTALASAFTLNADGPGGGRLVLNADRIRLSRTAISARTSGAGVGLGVDLLAGDSFEAVDGYINANNSSTGSAGDIRLSGGDFSFDNLHIGRARLSVFNTDDPRGNTTLLNARNLPSFRPGMLAGSNGAISGSATGGSAGNIIVSANRFSARNSASINVATQTAGTAGNIAFSLTDALTIDRYAFVGAQTFSSGAGGSVSVSARSLYIGTAATVEAKSSGSGPGGRIDVTTSDDITIDNTPPVGKLVLATSGFAAGALGAGNAGNINLRTGELRIHNGSTIVSTSESNGNGGPIEITTSGSVSIANRNRIVEREGTLFDTGIFASTVRGTGGTGGSIQVSAGGNIDVGAGGAISSETNGGGNAGTLSLDARGNVHIYGNASRISAGTFSNNPTRTFGNAGSIEIRADGVIRVEDGGSVTTFAGREATDGLIELNGNGGDLTLTAGRDISLVDHAIVSAAATGDGGTLALEAPRAVTVINSTITAKAGGNGRALRISGPPSARTQSAGGQASAEVEFTKAQTVGLDSSTINALAEGAPVLVNINSQQLIKTVDSQILTNEPLALPPEVDISGSLAELPDALAADAARLSELCGQRLRGDISSFVVTGRGGAPLTPGSWAADLPLVEQP